jgi:predicted AlkP superfamily pyrophosphatase or phosphodiesterase
MVKTVVLNIVGLTSDLIGIHTPFLKQWSSLGKVYPVKSAFPAVTCTAQANYLTGVAPQTHGIVGNGWYFHEECEIKFWKQSNKLVQSPKLWELAKKKDPSFTCANIFWWYNMYSSADYSISPRPQYPADGRKIPDVYTNPPELRDTVQKKLGAFPLFEFWGPATSIRSSQWIAEASKITDDLYDPTLTLIYLPHLDYCLQKLGPDDPAIAKDLLEIDKVCEGLIKFYEARGAQVIALSEYGITKVEKAVALNRALRENGLIKIRKEQGLELLDAGASEAFVVADHQVAHVYINDKSKISKVKNILENTEGVEFVLDEHGKNKYSISHSRAGDLIAVADPQSWFSYYYWMEDCKAPDFARTVDIHRKPGYDPVEMFFDPEKKFIAPRVGIKLMKKKLGFRTLMNLIPLDDSLIKGSHGRIPKSEKESPVFITKNKSLINSDKIESTDICNLILSHLHLP